MTTPWSITPSLLTDDDLHLFNEGRHFRLYEKLGAHLAEHGKRGAYFAVWAPNAQRVSVIGSFNAWDPARSQLTPRGMSGVWEGFLTDAGDGDLYKFHIESRYGDYQVDKADPFGLQQQMPPQRASVVRDVVYTWGDREWMASRRERSTLHSPIAVYELHLGSWMRIVEEGGRSLTYREAADRLCGYVSRQGFTHVEFLPLMEHPFFGSWGYQTTGYFAPTSRHGAPEDFMYLIDRLHQEGIGVLLDWVPSHFPSDEHGLVYFDGTHLFEHGDPRQGFHPDWNSYIFNYGRNEVRSFLISSAIFWLDRFHVDGLRVDAVASMLYLDYSRKAGEWIPNKYGGRENIEALDFLRQLNEEVYRAFPDVQTIAEESTSWPMVSRPTYLGGLGFGMKWDMGWMHDTLQYMSRPPVYRKHHHNELTFRQIYAFSENFMLPLSHDEVVHGKRSLLGKMPGDAWQQFANLRLLLGYMYGQPGKKLLFMGDEIGQGREWNHDASVDWDLLAIDWHSGVQKWVSELNRVYRGEPALHELDCDSSGFEWVEGNDSEYGVLSFLRKSSGGEVILVVCGFTPVPHRNYRLGVPYGGEWRELLNSDATEFMGSGQGNFGGVHTVPVPLHGRPHSVTLTVPPLGTLMLKHVSREP